MKNSLYICLAALLPLVIATGCDRSGSDTENSKHGEEASGPATPDEDPEKKRELGRAGGGFTWKDALESTPDEASKALGSFDECKPDARLPGMGPSNRQLWLAGIPFCRFENEPDQANTEYKITGILFSKGDATMVELEPRDETRVSNVVEAFGLPRFDVERRSRVGRGAKSENRLMLRPREVEMTDGELIGIDVFSKPESPARVELVRVAAFSRHWPSLLSAMQVDEPSAVTAELVMPATTSEQVGMARGPYAELGASEVSLSLGIEVPGKASKSDPSPIERFPVSKLKAKPRTWSKSLERVFAAHEEQAKALGQRPSVGSVTLSAERTLPASSLLSFLKATADRGPSRFRLLGRAVESLAAPFTAYADVRQTELVYSPTIAAAPVRSRTRMTVEVRRDGMNVYTKNSKIPPQDGCPSNGPTICLANDGVDVRKQLEQARDLQQAGDFEAAESHVRKALSAHDWARLYRVAILADGLSNHNGILFLIMGEDVFVAEAMRAVDVVRYKRGRGPKCREEFDSSQELFEFGTCTASRRGRPAPATLFPHVVVTESR